MRSTVVTRSRRGVLVLALAPCFVAGALGVAGCGSAAKPADAPKAVSGGQRLGGAQSRHCPAISSSVCELPAPKAVGDGNGVATQTPNVLISDPFPQAPRRPAPRCGDNCSVSVIVQMTIPVYRAPTNPAQFRQFCAREVAQGHAPTPEMAEWLMRTCVANLRHSHHG